MGASQSTRKLTISNEDELGVIHISSGVAQRLANGIGNATKEASSEMTVENSNARHDRGNESDVVRHENFGESVHQPPRGHPVVARAEYTMSALEMQQQKEQELRNQDLYWQKRLANMKENHVKTDRILEAEYQRAVDQVASAQGKQKIDVNSVVPPCIENKDKVLRCYQDNPKEILNCSSLVEEFSNCVDERRGRLIAARC